MTEHSHRPSVPVAAPTAADPAPRDLDPDLSIEDEFLLRTVPGAVDHLAQELTDASAPWIRVLRRRPDGLLVSCVGPLRPLLDLRLYDIAALPLGPVDALEDPSGVVSRLRVSVESGLLAALAVGSQSAGALRFRVGDIGPARWALAEALRTQLGWVNSVGSWQLNFELDEGDLVAQLGPLYLTSRFGVLRRMPASTNPVIAEVMARLAKIEPGHRVLDPCCGAGTLLYQAGRRRPDTLVGVDLSVDWLRLASENLTPLPVRSALIRGDAAGLPFAAETFDRVLANLPFGKRIGNHAANQTMYPRLLRHLARVLVPRGRAVLLTDDKRILLDAVQRAPKLRVVRELTLTRGGLHPSAYVVAKR